MNCPKPVASTDKPDARNRTIKPFIAVVLIALAACLTSAPSFAETRSLKLYHLHTHEKAEIVYKRNGRYDKAGLKKINHILRDWRRNEPINMDPRLLDLVWQAYRQSGSNAYIQIISGYRAPATNSMLRSRTKGVAKKSTHMLGKAMDFYIPGVPLKKLRDIGLKMQGGGVGYYPTSGSPFVHMDLGNVRHWPRIGRKELARVFPNGKTLHVPSDGKPLPGYQRALVAYQARKSSGTPNIESAGAGASKSGGLLAALFGNEEDEVDDMADVATAATAPRAAAPRPTERPRASAPGIAIVAPENAQRADIGMASSGGSAEVPSKQAVIAALAPDQIPVPVFAERSSMDDAAPNSSAVPLPTWRPSSEPLFAAEGEQKIPVVPVGMVPKVVASHPSNANASRKADRVTADSRQAVSTPVAMQAQLHARYWPHRTEFGISEIDRARPARRLAAHFIRTTPVKVYIDGFNADRQRHDPRRFSGTAVNFLPFARFK